MSKSFRNYAVLVFLLSLTCGYRLNGQGQARFATDRFYWATINGRLDKWDFHTDGKFLHQGVAGGAGTSVRTSERGVFRIEGNQLILVIQDSATAFATPGSGRNSTLLGGGSSTSSNTRTVSFRMIGVDGADGVMLNGAKYGIRHGW